MVELVGIVEIVLRSIILPLTVMGVLSRGEDGLLTEDGDDALEFDEGDDNSSFDALEASSPSSMGIEDEAG